MASNNAFTNKGATSGLLSGPSTSGIISSLFKKTTPTTTTQPTPTVAPKTTATPKTTTSSSKSDAGTLALQKELNAKNAGQPGWTPLVEDGILGPKTSAAMNFKPTQTQGFVQPEVKATEKITEIVPEMKQPEYPTYAGLLTNLQNLATKGSEGVGKARENLSQFQQAQAQKYADIESQTIPIEFIQGRSQAVQRAAQTKEAALQTALQSALTEQGQQLGALGTAAGLAQPVQVPFGTQFVNPLTGGLIGGAGGVSQGPDITSLARQVISGQLSPTQADALLSNNLGLVNQLNQEILRQDPTYNRIQAEAGAQAKASETIQTGTTGGEVSKAAVSARQALDTLQGAYDGLSKFTGGSNIPIVNQIAQNLSLATGLGREAVSQYQGALQEARAQVSAVLSPVIGVDAARSAAVGLLPDNMIPSEVPQKIKAAKEYIDQRVSALTTPQYGKTSTSSGGGFAENW